MVVRIHQGQLSLGLVVNRVVKSALGYPLNYPSNPLRLKAGCTAGPVNPQAAHSSGAGRIPYLTWSRSQSTLPAV